MGSLQKSEELLARRFLGEREEGLIFRHVEEELPDLRG